MNWNTLNNSEQLSDIDKMSFEHPVLLFKHSTRCSISMSALGRVERNWKDTDHSIIKPYYLDLLNYRSVSNDIASHYGIEHESPQALIIKNGKCVYVASHLGIMYEEILEQAVNPA
ncbi:MAG: bacillithiol system redox-active protein YtxJ [Bacteroidia bacterium]